MGLEEYVIVLDRSTWFEGYQVIAFAEHEQILKQHEEGIESWRWCVVTYLRIRYLEHQIASLFVIPIHYLNSYNLCQYYRTLIYFQYSNIL
jgi:hypothetical protein